MLSQASPIPPGGGGARMGSRGSCRIGHKHDVRRQRAAITRVGHRRRVKGERVEVEHEARACKCFDREEPRICDRRIGRVTGAEIETGVDAKGHCVWVTQKR